LGLLSTPLQAAWTEIARQTTNGDNLVSIFDSTCRFGLWRNKLSPPVLFQLAGFEPIWVQIPAHTTGVQWHGCAELSSIAWFDKFEIQGKTTLDILEEIGE